MILQVKIHPNSKENKIIKFNDNILELKIKAPAIEGKANKELIKYLSEIFNIKKSSINIKNGEHSKIKLINIDGLDTVKIDDVKLYM